jgi:hypothetical protein
VERLRYGGSCGGRRRSSSFLARNHPGHSLPGGLSLSNRPLLFLSLALESKEVVAADVRRGGRRRK